MQVPGRFQSAPVPLELPMSPTLAVRGYCNQNAAGLKHAVTLLQLRQRIVEVFNHMAHHYGVKATVSKFLLVERALPDLEPSLPCPAHRDRIGVNAFHRPSQLGHQLKGVAA